MNHMKSLSGIHQWYGRNRGFWLTEDTIADGIKIRGMGIKNKGRPEGEKATLAHSLWYEQPSSEKAWTRGSASLLWVLRRLVPKGVRVKGALLKGVYLGATECWAHQECGVGEEGRAMANPLAISACLWAGANCKELGERSDLGKKRLMGTIYLTTVISRL